MHGKDDDLNMRIELPYFRKRLYAVHDGHLYIQQNNVWFYVFEQVKQLHPIVRLGYQFHIFTAHEGSSYAGAEERMVVGDGYFNRPVDFEIFHTVIISIGGTCTVRHR
jgi:hypothetical protein